MKAQNFLDTPLFILHSFTFNIIICSPVRPCPALGRTNLIDRTPFAKKKLTPELGVDKDDLIAQIITDGLQLLVSGKDGAGDHTTLSTTLAGEGHYISFVKPA
jgi:hypothetical protein